MSSAHDLAEIARSAPEAINAELQVASAYETRLPDKSEDVVFCMSILHHLQLDRVKSEMRRILKSDGLFILKEPRCFSKTMNRLRPLFPSKEVISELSTPWIPRK